MNIDTGEIRARDQLTPAERASGKWRPLTAEERETLAKHTAFVDRVETDVEVLHRRRATPAELIALRVRRKIAARLEAQEENAELPRPSASRAGRARFPTAGVLAAALAVSTTTSRT